MIIGNQEYLTTNRSTRATFKTTLIQFNSTQIMFLK